MWCIDPFPQPFAHKNDPKYWIFLVKKLKTYISQRILIQSLNFQTNVYIVQSRAPKFFIQNLPKEQKKKEEPLLRHAKKRTSVNRRNPNRRPTLPAKKKRSSSSSPLAYSNFGRESTFTLTRRRLFLYYAPTLSTKPLSRSRRYRLGIYICLFSRRRRFIARRKIEPLGSHRCYFQVRALAQVYIWARERDRLPEI